jgi:hypothetical protein
LKKAGFIVLIILLSLQAGGLLVVYQVQQSALRHQMQQALKNPDTELEKLTLTLTQYCEGKRGEDELCLKGKMYDVKTVKFLNNEVTVLAASDTREDGIIADILDIVESDSETEHKFPKSLIELLTLAYILPGHYQPLLITAKDQKVRTVFKAPIRYRNSSVFVPPPRGCIVLSYYLYQAPGNSRAWRIFLL